jgi:hypothetical protein
MPLPSDEMSGIFTFDGRTTAASVRNPPNNEDSTLVSDMYTTDDRRTLVSAIYTTDKRTIVHPPQVTKTAAQPNELRATVDRILRKEKPAATSAEAGNLSVDIDDESAVSSLGTYDESFFPWLRKSPFILADQEQEADRMEKGSTVPSYGPSVDEILDQAQEPQQKENYSDVEEVQEPMSVFGGLEEAEQKENYSDVEEGQEPMSVFGGLEQAQQSETRSDEEEAQEAMAVFGGLEEAQETRTLFGGLEEAQQSEARSDEEEDVEAAQEATSVFGGDYASITERLRNRLGSDLPIRTYMPSAPTRVIKPASDSLKMGQVADEDMSVYTSVTSGPIRTYMPSAPTRVIKPANDSLEIGQVADEDMAVYASGPIGTYKPSAPTHVVRPANDSMKIVQVADEDMSVYTSVPSLTVASRTKTILSAAAVSAKSLSNNSDPSTAMVASDSDETEPSPIERDSEDLSEPVPTFKRFRCILKSVAILMVCCILLAVAGVFLVSRSSVPAQGTSITDDPRFPAQLPPTADDNPTPVEATPTASPISTPAVPTLPTEALSSSPSVPLSVVSTTPTTPKVPDPPYDPDPFAGWPEPGVGDEPCADDPSYLYTLDEVERDCEWVARQPTNARETLCADFSFVREACLLSCDHCSSN